MANLNQSILIGRLTADPELKHTQNNIPVTSFTIAVNRKYKDGNGNQQADFINIVAWRTTAEFITKYFRKGQAILIVGSIQSRSYEDKEGKKRVAFEVVADEVQFAEPKRDGGNNDAPRIDAPQAASSENDFTPLDDDDELPF